MTRALARLAIVMVLAGMAGAWAQSALSSQSLTQDQGSVYVPSTRIEFDIASDDIPGPGNITYVYATAGSPFRLATAASLPGDWLLDVRLSAPLRQATSLATIPGGDLEVRGDPTNDSTAAECPVIPWTPIGEGTHLALIVGPGVCRYEVQLRLAFSGRYSAGSYQGELSWALYRATP